MKLGLVLGGGGGRGAYQIGVWEALEELEIAKHVEVVSGTSIGALNAMLFMQGDLENAKKAWVSLHQDEILPIDKKDFILQSKIRIFNTAARINKILDLKPDLLYEGEFSREGLVKVIDKYLDMDKAVSSGIPCYCTCADLVFKDKKYFRIADYPRETIKEILLASSAIPGLYDAVDIGGRLYLDGGLQDNVPITPVYTEGCDIIIAIRLCPEDVIDHKQYPGAHIIDIALEESTEIHNEGLFDFSQETISAKMKAGYEATMNLIFVRKVENNMVKRLISATASQVASMSKKELLESIESSEGRVVVTECIPSMENAAYDMTQMELAAAFGSDIILINMFDVNNPVVHGIEAEKSEIIKEIKNLTGRPVGINLEPVDLSQETIGTTYAIPEGRKATAENAQKAVNMGVDFIVLTGNPGMGVSNDQIIQSLKEIRQAVGDDIILIAGKMHASGSRKEAGSGIISKNEVKDFIKAGTNIVLIPAPGTVPGVTLEFVGGLISYIHELGGLAMTAIGTSQEGADTDTIKQIALMCKMAGADLHHMGDGGSSPGMTDPENIMAYSIVIRGKRHTYNKMALSIHR